MEKIYKMAVCDIDGTLLNDKGKITAENKKAVTKMKKNGFIFALCTGRNIKRAVPIAKKLGITTPVVCIDGILLYDVSNKNTVYKNTLKRETVERLVDIGEKYEIFTEISNGYGYFKMLPGKESESLDFYHRHDFYGKVKNYFAGIRYFGSYSRLKKVKGDIYQVVLATKSRDKNKIKSDILALGDSDIEIRDSLWDGYMFINKAGAGKAAGVKELCKIYGINSDQTVAFGDDNNDTDMLIECGVGIAMGNANENVKKYADTVISTNNESGVAKGLYRYFDI